MRFALLFLCLLGSQFLAIGNSITLDSIGDRDSNWRVSLTMGFDFAQLLHINPQQGAGQNKLSLNSAIGLVISHKKDRFYWDNDLIWQFGAQRLGGGAITSGFNIPVPFQKSLDDFRINSKFGFQMKNFPKWLYSLNLGFRTIITPTYNGDQRLSGNFFKDIFSEGKPPSSKFFSPAIFTLSMGSEYVLDEEFMVFYSPISLKCIVVENDYIASTGVHGNITYGIPDSLGIYESFENTNLQFGSYLRVSVQKNIFKSKLKYQGSLVLFSNYLRNPQNIDIDMVNTLNWNLYKNFNFSLMVNLFYDDDVLVQITDRSAVGGISKLGKGISMMQQLLITYQVKF
jgi:hypothetical protein